MRKTTHGFGFLGLIISLAIIGLVLFLIFGIDYSALSDILAAQGYEPTPEMAKLLEKDDLTSTGKRIFNASRPELQDAAEFNQNCYSSQESNSSVLGCYTKKRVYVYNITDSELDGIRETVLAHELLHAVWARLSSREKENLQDDLESVYKANKDALAAHMKTYSSDEYYDELHSVIGSQIPESSLTSDLSKHYARYFNNRETIVGYFNKYNGKFEKLEQEASSLAGQIDEKRAEIEQRTAKYKADFNSLSTDIENFNNRAASGSFASQSEFQAERAELLNRQNQLNADYDALSNIIDETNALIERYNDNVTASNKLYDTINSRVDHTEDQITSE